MTLDDCADVLTLNQLVAVLQISRQMYYKLKQHGAFPIAPLPSLGTSVRFSKSSVQRYLDATPRPSMRRTA